MNDSELISLHQLRLAFKFTGSVMSDSVLLSSWADREKRNVKQLRGRGEAVDVASPSQRNCSATI
jgi:hypothetical protein